MNSVHTHSYERTGHAFRDLLRRSLVGLTYLAELGVKQCSSFSGARAPGSGYFRGEALQENLARDGSM